MNGQEIGAHEGDGVPFELDATEFLNAGRPNLLAVRVINPTGEPIDGLVLAEVPHSNKALADDFRPGPGYNFGGIVGEVVVHIEPAARLLDVFVRSQLGTGVISVDVEASNAAASGPPMVVERPCQRRQHRFPRRRTPANPSRGSGQVAQHPLSMSSCRSRLKTSSPGTSTTRSCTSSAFGSSRNMEAGPQTRGASAPGSGSCGSATGGSS